MLTRSQIGWYHPVLMMIWGKKKRKRIINSEEMYACKWSWREKPSDDRKQEGDSRDQKAHHAHNDRRTIIQAEEGKVLRNSYPAAKTYIKAESN